MIITYNSLPNIHLEVGETPISLKAGTFDLFHEGHVEMLQFLKSLGGISVVGISPDSRVGQRKGPHRPIRNEQRRAEEVDDSGLADYVFVMPEGLLGVPKAIWKLRPNQFVEHQSDTINRTATRSLLELVGVEYVVSDAPRICSTTEIIAATPELYTRMLKA